MIRNLAQDYLNVGLNREAAAAAERAIRIDPDEVQPYTTLASAKYALQDYGGAYDAAVRALALDPADKIAYSILKLARSRVALALDAEGESYEDVPAADFAAGPAGAPARLPSGPAGGSPRRVRACTGGCGCRIATDTARSSTWVLRPTCCGTPIGFLAATC